MDHAGYSFSPASHGCHVSELIDSGPDACVEVYADYCERVFDPHRRMTAVPATGGWVIADLQWLGRNLSLRSSEPPANIMRNSPVHMKSSRPETPPPAWLQPSAVARIGLFGIRPWTSRVTRGYTWRVGGFALPVFRLHFRDALR